MPSVAALANGALALKLTLAGLPVQAVADAQAAEATLDELLESDVSVVVVQEDLRSGFSEWFIERMKRRKGGPLVVYCPGFEEEESDVDAYLNAVLRPAIGYEIRLE
ncbi:MAG: V-type ATP synthase subunit F [Candidatus Hydrogenedentales bacterium]|jgi:vacuolar-type H+-ATPase subunit F/Vma7